MKTIPDPTQNCNHRLQSHLACNYGESDKVKTPLNFRKYKNNQNQPDLQPSVGEFNAAKSSLIESAQLLEFHQNKLFGSEATARRLRLWTGSNNATTNDDQPEVD